jgi:predicted 3-demethylubiquinone-9 3-methyltransferase (glyoxalase superfamily)
MAKIVPHLWYTTEAVEAANFYAATFADSRVDKVSQIPIETPSGPPGSVDIVEFTLCGQPFMAIAAGPLDPFNHSVSFMVNCDDQAEIDRYWDALKDGGSPEQCGWIRDRYGLCWQIVPKRFSEMQDEGNEAQRKAVMGAMMTMVKFDIAELERAYAAAA